MRLCTEYLVIAAFTLTVMHTLAHKAVADEQVIRQETRETRTESGASTASIAVENLAPKIRTQTVEKTIQDTWVGTVKQVTPSRSVIIVDGKEFALAGPMKTEVITHSNQKVKVIGLVKKDPIEGNTIEITKYEIVE